MVVPFDSFTDEDAEMFYPRESAHFSRYFCAGVVGNSRVVDLGCGRGLDLQELYSRDQYLGVDCSAALIRRAQRDNPGYSFVCADLEEFLSGQASNSFSYGLIQSVLEHVESLEIAVNIYRESARVCETLLVSWHIPPSTRTGLLVEKVKAHDMREKLYQNKYPRGEFGFQDLQVESRRLGITELWTVRSR